MEHLTQSLQISVIVSIERSFKRCLQFQFGLSESGECDLLDEILIWILINQAEIIPLLASSAHLFFYRNLEDFKSFQHIRDDENGQNDQNRIVRLFLFQKYG